MDHPSRQDTHDTGSPQARARDDLRTANKKQKPNEERDEQRDKDLKQPNQDDEGEGEDESDE